MRELARAVIDRAEARRRQPQLNESTADAPTRRAELLASETMRLARMASTIHLSQAARLMQLCDRDAANTTDSVTNDASGGRRSPRLVNLIPEGAR